MTRVAPAVLLALLCAAPGGAEEPPSMLISRQLAEARNLRAGDLVRLAADPKGAPREFRVAGVYEPTPDPVRLNAPKHEARLHLPDLLALTADPRDPLDLESVGAVTIALAPGADPDAFSLDLAARLPGIIARPVAAASSDAGVFVVLERFHLAIALVTIVASTVFLLALTVMLVDERRETVGVLRLIGFRSGRIIAQVFLEGVVIAGAGVLFGIALALASEAPINRFFQWRYDTALVFVRITPSVVLQCAAIAVPLGVAGTVVASWALLRRNALRLVRR